jgi:Xaa-Pro aminopeptidase
MNLRLQKLRKLLKEQKLDAVLISSLPDITYLSGFSGFTTEDRDAFLLITIKKQYIFTHGIYKEAVAKQVTNFTLIDIRRENPVSIAVKKIVDEEKIKHLGYEAFDLKVAEYDRLTGQVDKKILSATDIVNKLRITKSPDEIQAIKKACKLSDSCYSHILKNLRMDMTEKEIAFEIEMFIKKQGTDISFPPIVAFNAHASQPHHVADNTRLKRNTVILLDFGVKLNNYCSDMTRTVFFGKVDTKQKDAYEKVLSAQQKTIDYLKSSLRNPKSQIVAKKVDRIARDYISSKGYPSMPHSLGHGIGLEIHEAPRLTPVSEEMLKPGMVFSIEPGIYLQDEFGIRIEDLFVIEENELIQLTETSKNFTLI